jgi:hypothetical protein
MESLGALHPCITSHRLHDFPKEFQLLQDERRAKKARIRSNGTAHDRYAAFL